MQQARLLRQALPDLGDYGGKSGSIFTDEWMLVWRRLPWVLFVLAIFSSLAMQHTEESFRAAYANSFEAFAKLRFDLDGLIPSLDELLAVVSAPFATIDDVVRRMAAIGWYDQYSFSYFEEGLRTSGALNFFLALVKLAAVFIAL